jgi:hypothetical protein
MSRPAAPLRQIPTLQCSIGPMPSNIRRRLQGAAIVLELVRFPTALGECGNQHTF